MSTQVLSPTFAAIRLNIELLKNISIFLALSPFNIHKDSGKIREQTLSPECLVSTPNPTAYSVWPWESCASVYSCKMGIMIVLKKRIVLKIK